MNEVSIGLSGSGLRLAGHVGALQAILDAGYMVTELVGAMGGSVITTLYGFGYQPKEILNSLLDIGKNSFGDFYKDNGVGFKHWLEFHIGKSNKIKDAKVPIKLLATDLNSYNSVIFDNYDYPDFSVNLACIASIAIPFLFYPVCYDGMYLIGGGFNGDIVGNYLDKKVLKFSVDLYTNSKKLDEYSLNRTLINRLWDTIIFNNYNSQSIYINNFIPIHINIPSKIDTDLLCNKETIQNLYNFSYETITGILENL